MITGSVTVDKLQFIFYFLNYSLYFIFWSFEISVNILRYLKYMIGLHSYSRQILIIWTPFWFISVFESTAFLKFVKLQYVSSAFVAGSLQGHWWGFISWNYVVWPIFFLMNVFIAHKKTHYTPGIYAAGYIVFVFPFVRSYVRSFVCSFVRTSVSFVELLQSFTYKQLEWSISHQPLIRKHSRLDHR